MKSILGTYYAVGLGNESLVEIKMFRIHNAI